MDTSPLGIIELELLITNYFIYSSPESNVKANLATKPMQ